MKGLYIQAVPTPFMEKMNICSRFSQALSFVLFTSQPRPLSVTGVGTGRVNQHEMNISADLHETMDILDKLKRDMKL